MKEFHGHFGKQAATGTHGHHHEDVPRAWDPSAMCDGCTARQRADWLIENERLSRGEAQKRVMREFHQHFAKLADVRVERDWNPNAMCDGLTAQARADWLVQNEGMSWHDAHKKVMKE